MHELLADDILADAGGRNKVVKLVEKFHTALMVLRGSLIQLVPQNQSHRLSKTLNGVKKNKEKKAK